jgi:hypothetical protein
VKSRNILMILYPPLAPPERGILKNPNKLKKYKATI